MSQQISPTRSRVLYGARPVAPADGETPILIKVKLRDIHDRPVVGRLVELSTDLEGVAITQPEATDAHGYALGLLYSTVPGTAKITATILSDDSSESSEGG